MPIEPNEWGHRKGCHEIQHPIDGTRYEWADKMGCVAKKTQDGLTTHVKEAECNGVGGTWHVRARSKEECEDNRGNVCTHPFDEWRVFGGITSEEKCDTCGYESSPPTKWRPGIWSPSAETPLYWVERAFSAKNKWEENSFDSSAFRNFVSNSISRYTADAYKSKVYCELGAYNAFIPAIISMCSADGNTEQNIVKYDLTTAKVSCGDLQDQPPMETYEGRISYANAKCTNEEDNFAETTMGKVVPLSRKLGSGRRTTSSALCSQHETIKNSNNAIVGQTLGSGLSVTNVDGATICIKPTVPDEEVCAKYVEFGIVTVDDSGSFSVPLSTTATTNSQGEICLDGSESGVTYAPVKLLNSWETSPGTTTEAPSGKPTVAQSMSPSPSLAPSTKPTSVPSGEPSSSSHPTPNEAGSVAPSMSLMPTRSSSASPSLLPSNYPSKIPTKNPTSVPSGAPSLSLQPSLNPTESVAPSTSFAPSGKPSLSLQPSSSPTDSVAPSKSSAPSGKPTLSLQPSSSALPSLAPSGLGNATVFPSSSPSKSPTKKTTGIIEVTFEVAVKLDGGQNMTDLSVASLDSIVDLLEKVFLSMVPDGARIRLLKVGGYVVARRLMRYLQEDGIDIDFEVIMDATCNTITCDNSDEIASSLYNQVTTDLKAQVEDGEVSRVIQEEAASNGVPELANVTVSSNSFTVTAAKVTVQVGTTEAPSPTVAPTEAPTSASTMVGHSVVATIMMAFLVFVVAAQIV